MKFMIRDLASGGAGIFIGLAIAGALFAGPVHWFFLVPALIFALLAAAIED